MAGLGLVDTKDEGEAYGPAQSAVRHDELLLQPRVSFGQVFTLWWGGGGEFYLWALFLFENETFIGWKLLWLKKVDPVQSCRRRCRWRHFVKI